MNSNKNDVSSYQFWNNKYINNEHSWDIGFPTPIFKKWSSKIDNPSNTNICIPGCGYGHDAIYLAEKGFNVHAIDFSKHATTHIIKKSHKNKNIKIKCINFFEVNQNYNQYFDYILEYTFYCAINPLDRINYIDKCYNILKDKGRIIAIMLPISDSNSKEGPPFLVNKAELKKNFVNKFNIIKIEKSKLSIESRKDIELYVEYEKK